MKKIIVVVAVLALWCSCKKNSTCWIYVDCAGNDIGTVCSSESEVKAYCASHSTASCTMTYRKQ